MTQNTNRKANGEGSGVVNPWMPDLEVPAAFREVADQAVTQAKDAYARVQTAAEEAIGLVGKTYEAAGNQSVAMNLKVLEISNANANASFEFFKDYIGAKTIAEAIEVQTAYVRNQFEAVSGQLKDIEDATQKAAVEVARPIRKASEKVSKEHRVA